MQIEIYSDGSATTADKPGGYGFVILINGKKHSEGSGYMERASNNDAELEAAIQGLKAAKEIIYDNFEPVEVVPSEVFLVSDSQLVLGWANGTYKFKQDNKLDKYRTLQLLVHSMSVKTRWVPGHSGDEHNERCDQLANEARLPLQKQVDKLEAIKKGDTLIGNKKSGTVCLWYKNQLKVVDLDQNIVEDYNRDIHGSRGTLLEIREEKSR